MDPNLFHIDWDQFFEVLAAVVVLAFVVERALALLFEHRWFVKNFDEKGLKEPIALIVSLVVCWYWDFDLVSVLLKADKISFGGEFLTAAVIAGGSKASVKLFTDLLGVHSQAAKAAKEVKEAKAAREATAARS